MADPKKSDELGTRVISAAVLAPLVLGAFYLGSPWSDAVILIAAVIMAWEWSRITARAEASGAIDWTMVLGVGSVAIAVLAGALGRPLLALGMLAAGAVAAGFASWKKAPSRAGWMAFGIPYLGVSALALLWLRGIGLKPIILLLVIVWATDSAAYFTGRALGGPKLAPRISPNKTWSGLLGGMAAAGLGAGVLTAVWGLGPGEVAIHGALGAVLGALSQGGDLLESHLKRCHGAKDASRIIPGHGGVLDRADGLIAAGLAMAALLIMLDA